VHIFAYFFLAIYFTFYLYQNLQLIEKRSKMQLFWKTDEGLTCFRWAERKKYIRIFQDSQDFLGFPDVGLFFLLFSSSFFSFHMMCLFLIAYGVFAMTASNQIPKKKSLENPLVFYFHFFCVKLQLAVENWPATRHWTQIEHFHIEKGILDHHIELCLGVCIFLCIFAIFECTFRPALLSKHTKLRNRTMS
jgi:hypothetical protein